MEVCSMGVTIYEDTRQQIQPVDKHAIKHAWWKSHDVEVIRKKLDVGDYMMEGVDDVSVDTKRTVDEIAMNIGGKNHRRFREECKRAQAAGIRLVVLIENIHEYEEIRDLNRWTNGHCKMCRWRYERGCNPHKPGKCIKHNTNKPIQGPRLAKAMSTMQKRYGVEFQFCHPRECGDRILSILSGGGEHDDAE